MLCPPWISCNIQITFCWRKQTRNTLHLSEPSWRVTVIAGCAPSIETVCTEYRRHETVHRVQMTWDSVHRVQVTWNIVNRVQVTWDVRSFGILRGTEWQTFTDVSGQPIRPKFEGQAVQKNFDCLTLPTISTKELLDPAYHPHWRTPDVKYYS